MNNTLVVGSQESDLIRHLTTLAQHLKKEGERICLLDTSGHVQNAWMGQHISFEHIPSEKSVLVVFNAIFIDFSELTYKNIIVCTTDQATEEELSFFASLTSEYHIFRFKPEHSFKSYDILGDVEFSSSSLPPSEFICISKG